MTDPSCHSGGLTHICQVAPVTVEREVLRGFADGTFSVPIAETFALEQAPDAYAHFTAGGKLGKVVLEMG